DTDELKSGFTTLWATAVVPEPSTYGFLFGSFLFAWAMLRRR
ncbi:MAG: PEP-CTERM sorting domain-containing protein, partial [Puniceicoccaceae bacterium]